MSTQREEYVVPEEANVRWRATQVKLRRLRWILFWPMVPFILVYATAWIVGTLAEIIKEGMERAVELVQRPVTRAEDLLHEIRNEQAIARRRFYDEHGWPE